MDLTLLWIGLILIVAVAAEFLRWKFSLESYPWVRLAYYALMGIVGVYCTISQIMEYSSSAGSRKLIFAVLLGIFSVMFIFKAVRELRMIIIKKRNP